MQRLIRTIASLTIVLGAMGAGFVATAATAGDNGSAGQPETPAIPPKAPAPPAAPAVAPPSGSAPAATPAKPENGAANAQNQGTPALVLDTESYEGLLGKNVRAANGDDLGRIIDIIIDRDGRPRAAIIDFGGFLGVGSRKIAVDWRVLKFTNDGKAGRVTLALNRNQVRVSPEYKTGEPIVVLGASGASLPPPEGEPTASVPVSHDKSAASDKQGASDKAPEKPEKTPDK